MHIILYFGSRALWPVLGPRLDFGLGTRLDQTTILVRDKPLFVNAIQSSVLAGAGTLCHL